ncbi:uncharacterized protein LOC120630750, partial [Pararge aegeria]|uniref:uncharacterized protein LOC120630750 n=1 Tax=Pararge aegeria TaxID=116150 RepID=UPI0019D1D081
MENFSDRSITLAPSDDLNYSKYWVNPCIGAEVLRGKKLRAQKLKSEQVAREYDVVDIDFDKPSCSTKRFQRNRLVGHDQNWIKFGHESLYPSRSATVMKKKKRHKSPLRASTRLKNQRTHNKCPIRIAELAVPTKRLCIETWRNKGETLPSFMVERLRQLIMDEKPIVKINEAINSFKKRKPPGKPRSQKKQYPYVKNKNLDQIMLLCAFFGYKISRKLLSPLNIALNSRLKPLSRIVSDELTLILCNNGRQSTQHINSNIQTELAGKVTIWIANILDDASYKLLLEDYQELKEHEGFVWEIIDDLVDNVVVISKPESLASLIESTSISELPSDLSNEVTNIQNNEQNMDMKTELSDN